MGTDLWADEQCGLEPDHLQVALPISLLVSESITYRVPPERHLSGILNRVDSSALESWDEDITSLDPLMSLPTIELTVQAEIRLDKNFAIQASVLMDTGSRIPILFRQNLIPDDYLVTAR